MKTDTPFHHFTFEALGNIESPYTVHNDMDSGYMDITLFPCLPGIIVTLNDVHTSEMPISDYLHGKDVMIINYCIGGRCEFRISDNEYRYVKDKFTSIGSLIISDRFHYPSSYYLGFEIYIYRELFTAETIHILDRFHIDINRLYQKYNNREKLSILKTDLHIQKLWTELYTATAPDNGLILLNILKILHFLYNTESVTPANTFYLTKDQATLAKEVHGILTSDLSRHVPMREIALRLNASETSLKNYFSAMFGMSVSEYMKTERLKKSAALLSETHLPVSEIAAVCGFSNQGRFARIFKEQYGSSPLEYRRKQAYPF